MKLQNEDILKLNKERMQNASNAVFMETLFSIAEKYNILSKDDIEILTTEKSHELFGASTKPILIDISELDEKEVNKLIHDDYENGRSVTRYYRKPEYWFHGKKYLASNDMYGKYKDGKRRNSDNRTPLYEWFMKKIVNEIPSLMFENKASRISKSQWLTLLHNPDIIGPVWGGFLAAFYQYKDGATCKQIAEKYGKKTNTIIGNGVQLAKRVAKEVNYPLEKNEYGDNRCYTVLFYERNNVDSNAGNNVWKLRSELYDALTEFDIMQYEWKVGEEEVPELSTKEQIDFAKAYIASKGFCYDGELIENFFLSLKSKPFVILAGTSGTGKTRLVRLFAEAIGAEYKLVSVRPDWSDSSDLFGYVNLKGKFVPGAIIDYIYDAAKPENINKPYFLCLDEMNLARVEYYLSDFLSIIETRHRDNKRVVTDEIILDKAASDAYGKMIVPENLYVIGTVNMDETTFPFSKKVLDRANTIEFSYVDLVPDFSGIPEENEPQNCRNDLLKTEYITLMSDVAEEDQQFVSDICLELQEINKILQTAQAHVGYRVRDEIVFYMLNNRKTELLEENAAFDNEIMQKILPRIQGSSASVKEMLCKLYKKCAGDYTGLSQASVSEQMQTYIDTKECKYKKSAEKICYMMRRFEEDGFTSYWL